MITKKILKRLKRWYYQNLLLILSQQNLDLNGKKYFAVEFLPGQFDQRADSALQCIDIVSSEKQNADILTSKIIILNDELSDEDLNKVKKFYINPIEWEKKIYLYWRKKKSYLIQKLLLIVILLL